MRGEARNASLRFTLKLLCLAQGHIKRIPPAILRFRCQDPRPALVGVAPGAKPQARDLPLPAMRPPPALAQRAHAHGARGRHLEAPPRAHRVRAGRAQTGPSSHPRASGSRPSPGGRPAGRPLLHRLTGRAPQREMPKGRAGPPARDTRAEAQRASRGVLGRPKWCLGPSDRSRGRSRARRQPGLAGTPFGYPSDGTSEG